MTQYDLDNFLARHQTFLLDNRRNDYRFTSVDGDFSGLHFGTQDLSHAAFEKSKMDDVAFNGTPMVHTVFNTVSLIGARFVDVQFTNVSFSTSNVTNAVFHNCTFENTHFDGCIMDHVSFAHSKSKSLDTVSIVFDHCNGKGADFSLVQFTSLRFRHSTFHKSFSEFPTSSTLWMSLSAVLLLAIGATIYKFACPDIIKEHTSTHWHRVLGNDFTEYQSLAFNAATPTGRGFSPGHSRTLRWISGTCYFVGGGWTIYLIASRVLHALIYLCTH